MGDGVAVGLEFFLVSPTPSPTPRAIATMARTTIMRTNLSQPPLRGIVRFFLRSANFSPLGPIRLLYSLYGGGLREP